VWARGGKEIVECMHVYIFTTLNRDDAKIDFGARTVVPRLCDVLGLSQSPLNLKLPYGTSKAVRRPTKGAAARASMIQ
jgi:hypothetical protein